MKPNIQMSDVYALGREAGIADCFEQCGRSGGLPRNLGHQEPRRGTTGARFSGELSEQSRNSPKTKNQDSK